VGYLPSIYTSNPDDAKHTGRRLFGAALFSSDTAGVSAPYPNEK
jgi:hypothetical protein